VFKKIISYIIAIFVGIFGALFLINKSGNKRPGYHATGGIDKNNNEIRENDERIEGISNQQRNHLRRERNRIARERSRLEREREIARREDEIISSAESDISRIFKDAKDNINKN